MKPKLSILSLTALLSASVAFAQGPLNPPAGMISPTMKSLDQVEPRKIVNAINTPGNGSSVFIISQPGSYYLTQNLTAPFSDMTCIQIAADNVTLDLNGFALLGGGNTGIGINMPLAHSNFALRNGIIRNWGGGGVLAGPAMNSLYENLQFTGNGFAGLVAGDGCVITKCVAMLNAGPGIKGGVGSTITACTSRNNTNGGHGFQASTGSTITGCSAGANNGMGMLLGENAAVSHCAIYFSNSYGIMLGDWSTVSHCSVSNGNHHGIVLSSNCSARENTCALNGVSVPGGFAGIFVAGFSNRVEGNNVSGNLNRGVKVTSSNNLIIANSAGNNGVNYDIVANNAVGPVVQAPASAAISGNTGAANVGSSDAHANISF